MTATRAVSRHRPSTMLLLGLSLCVTQSLMAAGDDELVIEIDDGAITDELVIEPSAEGPVADEAVIEIDDGAASDELVIEQPSDGPPVEDTLTIETDEGTASDALVIEPAGDDAPTEGELMIGADDDGLPDFTAEPSRLRVGLDQARLEYGYQTDDNSETDATLFGNLSASLNWQPQPEWELQVSARVDGHDQDGDNDFSHIKADYGDSYVRYRGDKLRLTVGAQTIIWGRLDELPFADRVSTADLTRFILDDLEDRRRANLAVRAEALLGAGKLDLVWLPDFRAAELPDKDSIWYPVNRTTGRVLGVDRSDIPPAPVRLAYISEDEPSGDGGFGARYTHSHSSADFGLTVARTRQSLPYFRVSDTRDGFVAQHPRSWTYGADAAIDAAGATWRVEVAYNSDTPVTRPDLRYTTTPSVSWGGGVEMHPGDGDARVNIQLVGMNLIDSPAVIDRREVYSLNGEIDVPFDRERWRASLDFFVGLGEYDTYLNPEVTFLGWEPHEVYLAAHYFDGSEQSIGGFHEDHSSVNLGWRAKF